MKFVHYPKCGTCKKAKKWLEEQGVEFTERDIVVKNPSLKELKSWHKKSGLPIKRFFNTSGMLYRELGLKDKLAEMTDEQKFELLATDGMLVKRPILITKTAVLTGFKEADWKVAVDSEKAAK